MSKLTRIVIVNRGEAAVRLIHAVREYNLERGLDVQTVALVTPPDAGALFAREADQSLPLALPEGGRAAAAYLDLDGVMEAVAASGADAVWVGWGFLAEDAAFAERVLAAGLTFIGPPPGAMRLAGDKVAAKRLAEQCGVPVVPWSGQPVQTVEQVRAAAEEIGYPVILKASAGGGGRGIREVDDPDQLEQTYEAARREALAAFGDDAMFVERCIKEARHVEVQVAVDARGHAVALGTRDCTVQRRHQKIVEECPGPPDTVALSGELERHALALAAACDYRNLGTVEFLLDPRQQTVHFMEINARLQVEHPVTELVFGVDLVKLQLDIADGQSIESLQATPRGHAMEVRLNAEDPDMGFAPAPGKLLHFSAPRGPGIRVDAGVVQGSVVPPDFDSMMAKVIAWGADRREALARLRRAVAEMSVIIEDGATNKGLLGSVLADPDFESGDIHTGWLDQKMSQGAFDRRPHAAEALLAGAALAYGAEERSEMANFYAAVARGIPQVLLEARGRTVELVLRGARHKAMVYCLGHDRYRIYLGGDQQGGNPGVAVQLEAEGQNRAHLTIAGRRMRLLYAEKDQTYHVEVEGVAHRITRDAGGVVRAPAPSMVMEISVSVGQEVEADQRLGSLEAMKMEMPFSAPQGGRVSAIYVQPNSQVAAGQPLLAIEQGDAPQLEGDPQQMETCPKPHTGPLPCADADPFRELGEVERHLRKERLNDPDQARRQALAEVLLSELRQVLLGHDVDPARLELLTRLLDADRLWDRLAHPDDYRILGRALVTFVDTEWLLSSQLLPPRGGHAGGALQTAFFSYLRRINSGSEGAHPDLVPLLLRALAHHGIEDLSPTARLRHAVARLPAAHDRNGARAEMKHELCSSLMRALMGLHGAGADFSEDQELYEALERVPLVARRQWPFLADNAHQTRYVIFHQTRFELRQQEHRRHVGRGLREAARLDGDDSARAVFIEDLARAPQSVFPLLGPATLADDPGVGRAALEVLLRRAYGPAVVEVIGWHESFHPPTAGGSRLTLASGTTRRDVCSVLEARVARGDAASTILLAAVAGNELSAVIHAVAGRCAADVNPVPVAADIFVHPEGSTEEELVAEVQRNFLAVPGLGESLWRLCLIVVNGGGVVPHYTFAANERGQYSELTHLRHLHPEMERRLELWRLSEFELQRIESHEHLVIYRGRARENPADERIFVIGEVGSAPAGEQSHDTSNSLPAFEHAYLEAIRALREIQSRRPVRRRYHWNRITLYVRPVVTAGRRAVVQTAEKLAAYTHGLGLERVVVRARLVDPEAADAPPVDTEVRVENPTGSKLEVRLVAPSPLPIPAAGPYELKVQKVRALGVPYPYEVIRMLTSQPGVMTSPERAFPPGEFLEYDLDPEAQRDAVPVAVERAPGQNRAGIVFGIISHQTPKHPEGMERVIILSDPLRGMGALARPECARIIAALELARSRNLPLEWVPISSGARIAMDSGTENLDWTARTLRKIVEHTTAGGEINIIVDGINVGAQSYFNAEATMLMHTRGVLIMTPRGSMVLTGKRALDYSGGVSAEDEKGIGGYERIMGHNGQAQYFADDLADAFRLLLSHYELTYIVPGELHVRPLPGDDAGYDAGVDPVDRDPTLDPYTCEDNDSGFETIGDLFSDARNPERKKPFDMRSLMAAVADRHGARLERFAGMLDAETSIIWDCHLGGEAVCLIGFEGRPLPRLGYVPGDGPETWTGGTLFPRSSKKVARAINAASGNRPVVVLANLSGFDGSPESMRTLQLEYGAEIGRAVVNFDGPLLFCVVARYHGGAYVVFSRALNEGLVSMAVEGSYASVIGGAPAAAVVFPREVRARTEADVRVVEARARLEAAAPGDRPRLREELAHVRAEVHAEKQGEVAREFDAVHSVQRACEVGSLDEVIRAKDLRLRLCAALRQSVADRVRGPTNNPGDGPDPPILREVK